MYRALVALLALAAGLRAGEIRLESGSLQIKLDSGIGYGITSIRDSANGRDFISSEAKLPLYRITLSRADGSAFDITSATAHSVSARQTASGTTLVFEHTQEHLKITCTLRAGSASPRVLWRIAIRNTGVFGVRSLFYPQWAAPLRLTPTGQNHLLYPFLDGQEFIDPGEHMPVGRAHRTIYPGQAALQLMAYHDGASGLLEMTQDGNGWLKHFRVARINGALDLSIEHNPNETPGKDIDLPYETVLEMFRGTWQDAADIYSEWALQQKWAKKIADRNLPRYLADGLPIVTFAMRGDPYSAEWSMYFPPSNRLFNPDFHPSRIPALEARYAEFFDSSVITNPFGWEHIAPWIAGDYFPPYGGESLWAATAQALRKAGSPLFMLLSGSRWGVNMDDVGYHERDRFLKEIAPRAAAYDSNGHPTEEDPPWAGSVQLCIGTPFAREHIVDAFTGCVQRGASIVQYDQNHGGMAFVCYNRQHPHPPGYGRWMVDETEKVFHDVRTECRRINPEFALGVEEPCEYFIPYWEIYMGRPYNFFGTGSDPSSNRVAVPLFIYVYHQYLLGYGGSNEMDIAHPYAEAIKVARKFTNGTLLDIDPGKPAYRLDAIPSPTDELRLARSCSRALRTYCRTYLIAGKMMRDPEIRDRKVESIRMWRDPKDNRRVYDLPSVDVPLVLESTWEANAKIGYVFANWQTSSQTVTFAPRTYGPKSASYGIFVWSDEGRRTIQEHGNLPRELSVQVPALSAILVEQTP